MRLDGGTVVRPDFDINPDHPAPAHALAQAGVKHQRTPMRDTGFDNHLRLQMADHLLHAQHVLGQLDDGAAHP